MNFTKTLLTLIAAGCFTAGFTSDALAQNSIQDADNDTRVETERSGDDDIVRVRTEGTDRLQFRGQRIEPLNNGQSIFLGFDAGRDDNLTSNRNNFIGYLAGQQNVNGQLNTAVGFSALRLNLNNSNNTAIGPSALQSLSAGTTNNSNTAIGPRTLVDLTAGTANTAIGPDAGGDQTSGSFNTYIGPSAGRTNQTGTSNVMIGTSAGLTNVSGSGNVFLGSEAGRNETGSNKLYISNTSTASPLIGGDFSAQELTFNSKLFINSPGGVSRSVEFKTPSINSGNDLLELELPSGAPAGAQFIEMEQGTSVIAKIDANGDFETSGNLHVGGLGDTPHRAEIEHNSSGTSAHVQLLETQTNDFARLEFKTGTAADYWHIAARSGQSSTSNNDLNFFYNNGTTSANIMTIEGEQEQVGIGTTNPVDAKLVIQQADDANRAHLRFSTPTANAYTRLEFDNDNSNTNNWQIRARTESTGVSPVWQIIQRSDKTDGAGTISTSLHIDGANNEVGINTTSPSAHLHVVNPSGSGTATAATLQIGSGEKFEDAGSQLLSLNSTLIPNTNGSRDLGSTTLQWRNLYLTGSVLFAPPGGGTSSARGASAPTAGLEEVLDMTTVSYDVPQADGSTVTRYGVSPESLREAAPELVIDEVVVGVEADAPDAKEGESFTKKQLDAPAVDQLGLIPVLVQAIQDQNAIVEDLQEENAELSAKLEALETVGVASEGLAEMLANLEETKREIEQLKSDLTACCMNAQGGGVVDPAGSPAVGVLAPISLKSPSLEQNTPNPFRNDTQIRYYLPEGMSGQLIITDQLGRELTRTNAETGVNFFRVEGGSLAEGAYRYSLVVDGQVVDTKQMVLTK